MARDEQYDDLMSAAEALLFVSDEPVSSAALAKILEVDLVEMDEVLALLAAEYMDDNRGIQLREVAGGWRFYTHPAHHEIIERYIISWDTHRMSQAALEALAIIAYHQPVTRSGVNAIRGVNSEGVVSSLVEKGLVREMGRDKPGGSILYGTTRAFLERFGLKSANDLPPLEDFAPDEESREYIRERLSGAGKSHDMQLELDDDELADDDEQVEVRVTLEDGSYRVEEVDSGDDERLDDAEGIAAIIGASMTEKAEFDSIVDDIEEESHDDGDIDDDDDEPDIVQDDDTVDETIQTIE
jgi:segregation and condensation protein B